jgi:hypothetical protein
VWSLRRCQPLVITAAWQTAHCPMIAGEWSYSKDLSARLGPLARLCRSRPCPVGSTYDWQSGNQYQWHRNFDGSTTINGSNPRTGTMWNETIQSNGDQTGWDSRGNVWQYNNATGNYLPFVLLQAIAELADEALRRGLDHLKAAEFLYETGLYPDLEYAFKHALTHGAGPLPTTSSRGCRSTSLRRSRRSSTSCRGASAATWPHAGARPASSTGRRWRGARAPTPKRVRCSAAVGRPTSVNEVNRIFRDEAGRARYRDIVGVSDEAIVSTDIIHDPRASIIDCTLTQVVDGDLVKVMSWYDNEWGYTAQLVREAKAVARADR